MDPLEKSQALAALKEKRDSETKKAEDTYSTVDELLDGIKHLSPEDQEVVRAWLEEAKTLHQNASNSEAARRALIATNTAGRVAVTTAPNGVLMTQKEVAGVRAGDERPAIGYGGHNGN